MVVYDLDGTLADTRQDITRAANVMRARMGLPPLARIEVCRHVGLGLTHLIRSCLSMEDPVRLEEGRRIYLEHYAAHLLDSTELYPGVREVLDHFQDRAQAVVTNKPDPYSRRILEGLGIAGRFRRIIAGDSGYPKKPDPEALLAILKQEGVPPEEALIVGDSPIDVETGRRAGVASVGVAQGFVPREELEAAGPDRLAEDFRRLLEMAKKEEW